MKRPALLIRRKGFRQKCLEVLAQRVGGAIGAAGAVVLLARAGLRTSAIAYVPVFAALTLLAAVTLIPALVLWRQLRREHERATAAGRCRPAAR